MFNTKLVEFKQKFGRLQVIAREKTAQAIDSDQMQAALRRMSVMEEAIHQSVSSAIQAKIRARLLS